MYFYQKGILLNIGTSQTSDKIPFRRQRFYHKNSTKNARIRFFKFNFAMLYLCLHNGTCPNQNQLLLLFICLSLLLLFYSRSSSHNQDIYPSFSLSLLLWLCLPFLPQKTQRRENCSNVGFIIRVVPTHLGRYFFCPGSEETISWGKGYVKLFKIRNIVLD